MRRFVPVVLVTSASNNRRAPPAFQMYSSDRLASRDFKLMTLAERGLLHSCELECWTNGNVPRDISALARTLGLDAAEVQAALTPRVLARFIEDDGALVCPDLEAYRAQLDDHHRRKSEGGKKGMASRWGNKEPDNSVTNSPNNSLSREEIRQDKVKGVSMKDENLEFAKALEGEPEFMTEAARKYAQVRG